MGALPRELGSFFLRLGEGGGGDRPHGSASGQREEFPGGDWHEGLAWIAGVKDHLFGRPRPPRPPQRRRYKAKETREKKSKHQGRKDMVVVP